MFSPKSNNEKDKNHEKSKEHELKRISELEEVCKKLNKITLKFELQTSEEDKLFGSVNNINLAVYDSGMKNPFMYLFYNYPFLSLIYFAIYLII